MLRMITPVRGINPSSIRVASMPDIPRHLGVHHVSPKPRHAFEGSLAAARFRDLKCFRFQD